MTSARWYRWVNTRSDDTIGIVYDPVPFSPGIGTEGWGHFIILGNGPQSVAYLGLDNHDNMYPIDPTVAAHSMATSEANATVEAETEGRPLGYIERIAELIDYMVNTTSANAKKAANKAAKLGEKAVDMPMGTDSDETEDSASTASSKSGKKNTKVFMAPVNTDGFLVGDLCSDDRECMTGMCEKETGWRYVCGLRRMPRFMAACILNLQYTYMSRFVSCFSAARCKGIECEEDSQCDTDRCDNGICVPKLGSCQPCDEDRCVVIRMSLSFVVVAMVLFLQK